MDKALDANYKRQVDHLVDQYLYGGKFPGVNRIGVPVQLVPIAPPPKHAHPPRPDLVWVASLNTPNGRISAAFDGETLFLGERPKWVEVSEE